MIEGTMNDELLEELRSIRALLMMDKQDALEEMGEGIDDEQLRILEELSYDEWVKSSDIKDVITDDLGISGRTFTRRVKDLEQKGFLEKEGQKSGTKYRKTGLLRMALTLANS